VHNTVLWQLRYDGEPVPLTSNAHVPANAFSNPSIFLSKWYIQEALFATFGRLQCPCCHKMPLAPDKKVKDAHGDEPICPEIMHIDPAAKFDNRIMETIRGRSYRRLCVMAFSNSAHQEARPCHTLCHNSIAVFPQTLSITCRRTRSSPYIARVWYVGSSLPSTSWPSYLPWLPASLGQTR
jgi:hypothetical protein